MELQGTVTSGRGEGAMFLSMDHYKQSITKALSFEVFAGTLNLIIDASQRDTIQSLDSINIEGFSKGDKKFGGVTLHPCFLEDVPGALIVPDINKHPATIIEFIAKEHLREVLKLQDKDVVTIHD